MCDNASAPLNLPTYTTNLDKCTETCEFKSNYPVCPGTLRNKGTFLSIMMDRCGANVSYNGKKFNLKEIRIFQPSLHTWDNKKADGEIFILHEIDQQSETGEPTGLCVCIPIKKGGDGDGGWFTFMALAPIYSANAEDQPVEVPSGRGWTLNSIIPKGHYYNYQATSPFSPCNEQLEMIVYSLDQAALCSARDFEMLRSSISQPPNIMVRNYSPTNIHKLYYHQDKEEGSPEWYFDCRDVHGDDPEDADVKESDLPIYQGGVNEGGTTTFPYLEVILISAGSLTLLVVLIKAWDYLRRHRRSGLL